MVCIQMLSAIYSAVISSQSKHSHRLVVEGLMWATNKSPLPPHIWLSYKICILGEKGA